MSSETARVVVATPLEETLSAWLEATCPWIELVRDPSLLPPQRWPADFEGDPAFRRTPEQQRRFDALVDSADVLYGIPDVSPGALARTVVANPRLRWVQVMAAGGGAQVRQAGLTAEDLERVVFTTSAGVHAARLAEFALFGLLAGAKHLPRLRALQESHTWPGRWPMDQLCDQTVLVAGLGHIGREVARLVQALGAQVVGVTRDGLPRGEVFDVVGPSRLPEAASRADAVVVALPGTEGTELLVGRAVFDALRPPATVVSVGRGSAVDEEALVRAIEAGRVGLAVLDVVAEEPLSPGSRLWDMPEVIVSPHTAANSPHEERLIVEFFADNLARWREGRPLRNVVDPIEFY